MNKLAGDADRNRRIVDSIASLPDDWTVLLFATSVENATVLAALLTPSRGPRGRDLGRHRHGGATPLHRGVQGGRIRVITNYNVLTQGFDAPAVQAVYVTRPTFSPNVYQQMIGRGLRGPLNGGSEEVLIVNVEDNFQQFGDQLAFLEFEHLWNPDLREVTDADALDAEQIRRRLDRPGDASDRAGSSGQRQDGGGGRPARASGRRRGPRLVRRGHGDQLLAGRGRCPRATRRGAGSSTAATIRTLDSLASRMLDELDEEDWRTLSFDERIVRALRADRGRAARSPISHDFAT